MNHFPFALRNAIALPFTPETDRRRHIDISGAAMGYPGARVILQDLSVEASFYATGAYVVNDLPPTDDSLNRAGGVLQMLMRIGWKNKGYLTEELLPYGLFLNGERPLVPTWNFVRPYRMDPGEALTATMWPLGTVTGANSDDCTKEFDVNSFGKCVGLMFHGTRIKDGNPIMLYDSSQELVCRSSSNVLIPNVPLTRRTLACPADSSILLHSVTVSNYDTRSYNALTGGGANDIFGSMVQIYSPSGRPWMSSIMSNLFPYALVPWLNITAQEATTYRHWIDPIEPTIDLGEERGWLKEASEQITVEVEMASGAVDQLAQGSETNAAGWPVLVTVRGVLEVPDA